MCLVTSEKTPFISTYNIQCYKILVPMGSKLLTPYRDYIFSIGEVIQDTVEESINLVGNSMYMIESGYFHSYKNLEYAKQVVAKFNRLPKIKAEIYNAEIPAGTPFYEGQFEDLCSKALKIIDKYSD